LVTLGEEILGFGVSWIKGLLDNPSIWVSDMLFSDRDQESTGKAEEFLEKTFFTEARIHHILKVIVTEYILLTNEELALWQEDSLKFFLHMKLQSNEVKGNFLREKAKGLIAGIQLRFSSHFESFCAILIEQLKTMPSDTVQQQTQKEAFL
jgi:hypothetical protein